MQLLENTKTGKMQRLPPLGGGGEIPFILGKRGV